MTGQFADYLFDMKMISSRNTKAPASNINSEKYDVVRSVIAAGLYPNIGKAVGNRGYQGPRVRGYQARVGEGRP